MRAPSSRASWVVGWVLCGAFALAGCEEVDPTREGIPADASFAPPPSRTVVENLPDGFGTRPIVDAGPDAPVSGGGADAGGPAVDAPPPAPDARGGGGARDGGGGDRPAIGGACDLFKQDCPGKGTACYPLANGQGVCAEEGSLPNGQTCMVPSDCLKGSACVNSFASGGTACQSLCDPRGTTGCVGAVECRSLGVPNLGFCSP